MPPALRRIAAGAQQAEQTLADELSTFRRLGQHPLAVSVSVPLAAVRAEWLRDTAVTAFFCLLAAAALGFATLLAIRRWQSEQLVLLRLRETADELRAEIARRVARTAKSMGIATVAVFSDADERARIEQHLAACATCRQLVDDLREITRSVATLEHRDPPVRVWSRIERAIKLEREHAAAATGRGVRGSPLGKAGLLSAKR